MRIGSTNVMTVGNFVGNVLKMECMFDNTLSTQKGIMTATGNLKTVIKESLEVARYVASGYLNSEEREML